MATFAGSTDDDTLTGTEDADTITGDAGNDILSGLGGADFIDGGSGNDTIYGGGGNDVIVDGPGLDVLYGGSGIDTFQRDWGSLPANTFRLDLNLVLGLQAPLGGDPDDADRFFGIENYTCFGFIGGRFTGSDVANVFRTDKGTDTIYGNGGDDQLYAGAARDRLYGGNGDDLLSGGADRDILRGGSGDDQFHFIAPTHGADRIYDFSSQANGNNDSLHFLAANFGGLPLGQLAPGRFIAREDNRAQDLNDRFIYNVSSGMLWFDRNGSLDGGVRLIADLQDGATLTHADIFMI